MHDDFAVEPVPGLPELPPEGERVLWQGRPRWWGLTKRLFQTPIIAAYFVGLAVWAAVDAARAGDPAGAVVMAALWPLVGGAVVTGLLALIALWIQDTTIYTITSRRVIVRFGLALEMTVNLPFRVIQEAQLKVFRDGTGNIPLVLMPGQSVSGLMLWPHVRPWRWFRPQPMLRAVAVPEAVATTLGEALKAHAAEMEQAAPQEAAAAPGGQNAQTDPATAQASA